MSCLPDLQRLSGASARLCLKVEQFCTRHLALPHASKLVLAVSGGADSVALACIFALLRPRLKLQLCALTVNHGLRKAAADDADHAQAVCTALAIPCTISTVDVSAMAQTRRCGLEEAGRTARYDLLEEYRRMQRADFILLGHHAEDLSEDIFLRLLRGAGWPALGGMVARDDTRRLLRPLLQTSPAALKDLVCEMGLTWREDESNTDLRFTRNRLRHTILPLLRQENPALEEHMARLWQFARWDADFWEQTLKKALLSHPPLEENTPDTRSITLSRALLHTLPPAVRLRLFHHTARRLYAERNRRQQGQVRADTLIRLEESLQAGRGNTCFQLPGGLHAAIRHGSVCFTISRSDPAVA